MPTLAEDIRDRQDARLSDFITETQSFVTELQAQATEDPFTVFPPTTFGGSSYTLITGAAGGAFGAAVADLPEKPDNLEYGVVADPGPAPSGFSLTDVTLPSIPEFTDSAPTLTFPTAPSVSLPGRPAEPTVNAVTVPDKPTIELPNVPTLASVNVPDAPTLSIPTFTEKFPDLPEIFAPSNNFEYVEELYENDMLNKINDLICDDLANGGFGITTDDEEAIFSRALDREMRTSLGREREIEDRYAQRGFRAPQGSLMELQAQNVQETVERVSAANREILVQRSELMRRAREFAVQQGISVNEILIRDFGFRQERALNAARFASEFAVTLLDAQIRAHNIKLEQFQAFTQSYEVQIRALLSQVEIFKSQVEAASIQQEINKSVVDVYEAQVRAATTVISLYQTELQAAQTQAEIEKLKIDQFEANVQAYVAQVRAQSEEFSLFESQVRAEGLKQDAFKAQVDAYASRVGAARTEAEVQLAVLNSDIRSAELQLEGYRSSIQKYSADVDAETRRVASLIELYGADTDVYRAILSGWEGLARVDVAQSDRLSEEARAEARLKLEEYRIKLEEIIKQKELRLSATDAGTRVFTDTLSAIANALQSIGIEESTATA